MMKATLVDPGKKEINICIAFMLMNQLISVSCVEEIAVLLTSVVINGLIETGRGCHRDSCSEPTSLVLREDP